MEFYFNMNMERRIKAIIIALVAMVCNATAQTLTVQSIAATAGEQATLTVSLSGATEITALQFNLALPRGVSLAESEATLGTASNGHTLNVQTLDNGDYLYAVYCEVLNTFMDGDLLSIPVIIGSDAEGGTGCLYTVRMANTEAVSQTCNDVTFTVTMKSEPVKGDVTDDGLLDSEDVFALVNYILGLGELANTAAADVNGDETVDIADVAALIELVK